MASTGPESGLIPVAVDLATGTSSGTDPLGLSGSSPLANHEKAVRPGNTGPNGAKNPPEQAEERYRKSRDARYRLREKGTWEFSLMRRCQWCGKVSAIKRKGGAIRRETPEVRMADGRAYWSGVMRCGSVWSCPVCSVKIRHGRALEAESAMRNWISTRKTLARSVLFLTLTMPHDSTDDLPHLISTIKHAFSRLFSGRPWRRDRDRFRIRAWLRVWDITHGKNGWHPHLHIALFVAGNPPPDELEALAEEWHSRWAEAVTQQGFRTPSRANGIHLEKARNVEQVSQYLLKVKGEDTGASLALELARGDLKVGKGRTPFQILQDFIDAGDLRDLDLFKDYEKAAKGQHFSRWSNGARELLGILDLSDQELSDMEVGGVRIFRPSPDQFHAIVRTPGALAKVLTLIEAQDENALNAYLTRILTAWHRGRRRGFEDSHRGPPGERAA